MKNASMKVPGTAQRVCISQVSVVNSSHVLASLTYKLHRQGPDLANIQPRHHTACERRPVALALCITYKRLLNSHVDQYVATKEQPRDTEQEVVVVPQLCRVLAVGIVFQPLSHEKGFQMLTICDDRMTVLVHAAFKRMIFTLSPVVGRNPSLRGPNRQNSLDRERSFHS